MRRSAALGLSVLFRWDAAFRAAATIVDLACCAAADIAASRPCALRASCCGVSVRFWTSSRGGCCSGYGAAGALPAAAARPAHATVDAAAHADQRAGSVRHGRRPQPSQGRKRVLWRALRGNQAA